jgi:mono/diheme cytochrome c family protein
MRSPFTLLAYKPSVLGVLVTAVVTVGGGRWGFEQVRPLPEPTEGDVERGAHAFLDSDNGSIAYQSVPRAVWDAIPVVFPELLPEGWRGVGLIERAEDPKGPPVGWVSRRVLGVEVYGSNCSLCHTGSFQGKLVVGAPNADLDIQYLVWVLGESLRSDSLNLDAVAKIAAEQGHPLGAIEREGVRVWLALAKQKMSSKPRKPFAGNAGAGRSDNLNGFKRMYGIPDQDPAMVDLVSVFNQQLKTRALADGSISGDHAARVMLAELQKGRSARDLLLKREVFDDINAFLERSLTPPAYPFAVEAAKAERGHEVFNQTCARCHGSYAPDAPSYPNIKIAAKTVGTDPERASAMTQEIAGVLQDNAFGKFLKIESTGAYVPPRLGGLWVTAPYLHNGSVPTLWHLLHPEQRPVAFYRRWNDFDASKVGLACVERVTPAGVECAMDAVQTQHDARTVTYFDTRVRGNSARGHLYGQDLPEQDKAALLEYLKTI